MTFLVETRRPDPLRNRPGREGKKDMVGPRCAKQESQICKARRVDGQHSHVPPPIPCKADLSMFITQTQAAMAAINPEGPRNPTALQVPLPCPRP